MPNQKAGTISRQRSLQKHDQGRLNIQVSHGSYERGGNSADNSAALKGKEQNNGLTQKPSYLRKGGAAVRKPIAPTKIDDRSQQKVAKNRKQNEDLQDVRSTEKNINQLSLQHVPSQMRSIDYNDSNTKLSYQNSSSNLKSLKNFKQG